MQRYSAVKKFVCDADGSILCSCRDAAIARLIQDALNSAEDGGRRGPGSVMIRSHRMKGVKVEWPDTPMLFAPREKLIAQRRQFDCRLAPLKRPGAAKRLRAAIKAPARLPGRVKKSSPRKRSSSATSDSKHVACAGDPVQNLDPIEHLATVVDERLARADQSPTVGLHPSHARARSGVA